MKSKRISIALAASLALASVSLISAAIAAPSTIAGLPRQADLGFGTSSSDGALIVRNVSSGSAAALAGLLDGDVILKINGAGFKRPHEGAALLERLDGGVQISLTIKRAGQSRDVMFVAESKPLERIDGLTSIYGAVEAPDGARLRTIIAAADGGAARPHPLLFAQWVSCDTVEFSAGDAALEILADVTRRSGLALIRVERAANGDSEGLACHELDYDTEVAHYVHAFGELLKSPAIDASKVYIIGSSLGSTTAPLIALALQEQGYDIAGVAVQGGGAETYFERMLTFDRQYLERRPEKVAPADIHDEMMWRAQFHHEYLIRGRNPDEIAKRSKDMAAIRADIRGLGDGEHYGRPYAWHQQAAKRNFLAAWDALDARVLVIFNEFDQFEARYGHKVIADIVNRRRPGAATFVEQANIDHSNSRYATIEDAYVWRDGAPAWRETANVIVEWLRAIPE